MGKKYGAVHWMNFVAWIGIIMLIIAVIINFSLLNQQKNDTNKNTMLATAAMSSIGIGLIIILYIVVAYINKESFIKDTMPFILPPGSNAAFTWNSLSPQAQDQLIKSGFGYVQNNPMKTIAAISAFS